MEGVNDYHDEGNQGSEFENVEPEPCMERINTSCSPKTPSKQPQKFDSFSIMQRLILKEIGEDSEKVELD
jgi:hypothetical protein